MMKIRKMEGYGGTKYASLMPPQTMPGFAMIHNQLAIAIHSYGSYSKHLNTNQFTIAISNYSNHHRERRQFLQVRVGRRRGRAGGARAAHRRIQLLSRLIN